MASSSLNFCSMLLIFLCSLVALTSASTVEHVARDSCTLCTPQGATSSTPPAIGSDMKSLYTDLLGSVKDIRFQKRSSEPVEARANGFCCQATLNCVNVQNINVPICYDKFTTNFGFPDGSYGSLTTGNYTSGDSQVNLISGQYTKAGGETGNIYANDISAKPNTATLSIPPQWTGTGVGQAIPASALGVITTITTVISGHTTAIVVTLPATNIAAATGAAATSTSTSKKSAGVRMFSAPSLSFAAILTAACLLRGF